MLKIPAGTRVVTIKDMRSQEFDYALEELFREINRSQYNLESDLGTKGESRYVEEVVNISLSSSFTTGINSDPVPWYSAVVEIACFKYFISNDKYIEKWEKIKRDLKEL